ncbi:hypothetical protein ES702_00081 [subsurface metagenome]
MKIALVGDYSSDRDEGLKNIAHYLAEELSKIHRIMRLHVKEVLFPRFWINLRKFHPEIIHYIPGPTVISFLIVKTIKLYSGAKTVMSAPQPRVSNFWQKLISLLKPDLILTQSEEFEERCTNWGCKTRFLPNGVNTKKFAPASRKEKKKLREKFGIDQEKFTILHVGHIMKRRNLGVLAKIQGGDNQVVIVASEYLETDHHLCEGLKETGCVIFKGHIKNIEEIYAMADCYVFPVKKGYTISTPLSVMEAMACNLPVISSKFEGLARIFKEDEGLVFAEREEDFIQDVENLKSSNKRIRNREKILPYSWRNVAMQLSSIYDEVFVER